MRSRIERSFTISIRLPVTGLRERPGVFEIQPGKRYRLHRSKDFTRRKNLNEELAIPNGVRYVTTRAVSRAVVKLPHTVKPGGPLPPRLGRVGWKIFRTQNNPASRPGSTL